MKPKQQAVRKRDKPVAYGVVTADLVESRHIGERARAQEQLKTLVKELNRSFRRDLAAPFMVTLGDEIQGLVRDLRQVPAVLVGIHREFHPREITIGVGVGDLATPMTKKVVEMDGPAFVNARTAVEKGKKNELQVIVTSPRPDADEVLNGIYGLIGGIQSRWNMTQWNRFNLYRELGTIEEVAQRLGVARQSVSKSLRHTLWLRVLSAEKVLPELFASLGEAGEGRTGLSYHLGCG